MGVCYSSVRCTDGSVNDTECAGIFKIIRYELFRSGNPISSL